MGDAQRKKYYSPFPKQRRFCCFIDRREYVNKTSFHKQLRKMDPFGHRGGGRMMDMFGMMGMYEYVRKDTKYFVIKMSMNLLFLFPMINICQLMIAMIRINGSILNQCLISCMIRCYHHSEFMMKRRKKSM